MTKLFALAFFFFILACLKTFAGIKLTAIEDTRTSSVSNIAIAEIHKAIYRGSENKMVSTITPGSNLNNTGTKARQLYPNPL